MKTYRNEFAANLSLAPEAVPTWQRPAIVRKTTPRVSPALVSVSTSRVLCMLHRIIRGA